VEAASAPAPRPAPGRRAGVALARHGAERKARSRLRRSHGLPPLQPGTAAGLQDRCSSLSPLVAAGAQNSGVSSYLLTAPAARAL